MQEASGNAVIYEVSSNLLSSTGNSNEDELRESLVDTTLSILKMLLQCFII
ncbi:hypothetical protein PIROE2DRAFT_10637 [Piromyces sp. E2]|nr:hypothetical protein PIROE2DRAFT_10637 [Piromyces sp. E2]|eukprot:OUM62948.1 hypothetical protein PIROE2DRAFT_10637 [Piromyces sp. E2]